MQTSLQKFIFIFFFAFVFVNFIILKYTVKKDSNYRELRTQPDNANSTRHSTYLKVDVSKIMEHCNQDSLVARKIKVEECLYYLEHQEYQYLTATTEDYEQFMLFHVYWKGEVTQKLAMVVKSYLFTQPLDRSKIIVWLKADANNENLQESLERNPYAKSLLQYTNNVQFHRFNTTEQITFPNSPWKVPADTLEHEDTEVSFSDTVRFILLERYGGIYIDADVLLLRDFTQLVATKRQFAYNWSLVKNMVNTAVFHMHRGSSLARALINKVNNNPKDFTFHPRVVFPASQSLPEKERMINFPVALFDPLWLKQDNVQTNSTLEPNLHYFDEAFAEMLIPSEIKSDASMSVEEFQLDPAKATLLTRRVERFFPGAYAYHWHNRWTKVVYPTSWFGILERTYDNFLEGKTTNSYGEILI